MYYLKCLNYKAGIQLYLVIFCILSLFCGDIAFSQAEEEKSLIGFANYLFEKGHYYQAVTEYERFIYFNPNQQVAEVDFNGETWEAWRKRGNDRHSQYVDPHFVDAAGRDFRLRDDSPALGLGFRPIDLDSVGPRPQ